MANATIRGSVMLRPARVAIITSDADLATVRRAVQMLTSVWGGMYCPIIDIARRPDPRRLLERLAVDFVWPIDDQINFPLGDKPGFRWRGRSPWGPFDEPQSSVVHGLLAPEHLAAVQSLETAATAWAADDPLDALFATWLGDYPDTAHGVACREGFGSHSNNVVLQVGTPIDSPLIRWASPIAATGADIEYTGDDPGPGLVIIDPVSPTDLLRFWNLRACGAEVAPWVEADQDRFEPFIRAWITHLRASDQIHHWGSSNSAERTPYIHVWPATPLKEWDPTSLGRLGELLAEVGIQPSAGHLGRPGWHGPHPITTPYRRDFSRTIESKTGWVEVDLPELRWVGSGPPSLWPGTVAADVNISSEDGLDPNLTTVVPRVRRLAELLDGRSSATDTFHRPNGHGGIYSVSAAERSLTAAFARPHYVLERMFNQPGWQCEQSDEGRFAARLGFRLGGANTQRALQPAVREILLRSATRGNSGVPYATLLQRGMDARGAWPDSLFSPHDPKAYVRNVILSLTELGLLRAVVAMTCPSCRNSLTLTPAELQDDIVCGFCEHRFPLALVLAWLGSKADWRYRIAGHVSAAKLEAALPVIATSAVLAKLLRGGSELVIDASGFTIKVDKQPRIEFDVATIVDTFEPLVVLGEVKSGRADFDANDLAHAELAQRTLRDQGIECFILFATDKESFSDVEVELLRAHCATAPRRLNEAYSSVPLVLPLTFTRSQLSVGWFSDEHPWRWGSPGDGLPGKAQSSCEKNIGLRTIELVREADDVRFQCRFDDVEATAGSGGDDQGVSPG